MTDAERCPCGCGVFTDDPWRDELVCPECGCPATSSTHGHYRSKIDGGPCGRCTARVAIAQMVRHGEELAASAGSQEPAATPASEATLERLAAYPTATVALTDEQKDRLMAVECTCGGDDSDGRMDVLNCRVHGQAYAKDLQAGQAGVEAAHNEPVDYQQCYEEARGEYLGLLFEMDALKRAAGELVEALETYAAGGNREAFDRAFKAETALRRRLSSGDGTEGGV